jgi:hypothetical protein
MPMLDDMPSPASAQGRAAMNQVRRAGSAIVPRA